MSAAELKDLLTFHEDLQHVAKEEIVTNLHVITAHIADNLSARALREALVYKARQGSDERELFLLLGKKYIQNGKLQQTGAWPNGSVSELAPMSVVMNGLAEYIGSLWAASEPVLRKMYLDPEGGGGDSMEDLDPNPLQGLFQGLKTLTVLLRVADTEQGQHKTRVDTHTALLPTFNGPAFSGIMQAVYISFIGCLGILRDYLAVDSEATPALTRVSRTDFDKTRNPIVDPHIRVVVYSATLMQEAIRVLTSTRSSSSFIVEVMQLSRESAKPNEDSIPILDLWIGTLTDLFRTHLTLRRSEQPEIALLVQIQQCYERLINPLWTSAYLEEFIVALQSTESWRSGGLLRLFTGVLGSHKELVDPQFQTADIVYSTLRTLHVLLENESPGFLDGLYAMTDPEIVSLRDELFNIVAGMSAEALSKPTLLGHLGDSLRLLEVYGDDSNTKATALKAAAGPLTHFLCLPHENLSQAYLAHRDSVIAGIYAMKIVCGLHCPDTMSQQMCGVKPQELAQFMMRELQTVTPEGIANFVFNLLWLIDQPEYSSAPDNVSIDEILSLRHFGVTIFGLLGISLEEEELQRYIRGLTVEAAQAWEASLSSPLSTIERRWILGKTKAGALERSSKSTRGAPAGRGHGRGRGRGRQTPNKRASGSKRSGPAVKRSRIDSGKSPGAPSVASSIPDLPDDADTDDLYHGPPSDVDDISTLVEASEYDGRDGESLLDSARLNTVPKTKPVLGAADGVGGPGPVTRADVDSQASGQGGRVSRSEVPESEGDVFVGDEDVSVSEDRSATAKRAGKGKSKSAKSKASPRSKEAKSRAPDTGPTGSDESDYEPPATDNDLSIPDDLWQVLEKLVYRNPQQASVQNIMRGLHLHYRGRNLNKIQQLVVFQLVKHLAEAFQVTKPSELETSITLLKEEINLRARLAEVPASEPMGTFDGTDSPAAPYGTSPPQTQGTSSRPGSRRRSGAASQTAVRQTRPPLTAFSNGWPADRSLPQVVSAPNSAPSSADFGPPGGSWASPSIESVSSNPSWSGSISRRGDPRPGADPRIRDPRMTGTRPVDPRLADPRLAAAVLSFNMKRDPENPRLPPTDPSPMPDYRSPLPEDTRSVRSSHQPLGGHRGAHHTRSHRRDRSQSQQDLRYRGDEWGEYQPRRRRGKYSHGRSRYGGYDPRPSMRARPRYDGRDGGEEDPHWRPFEADPDSIYDWRRSSHRGSSPPPALPPDPRPPSSDVSGGRFRSLRPAWMASKSADRPPNNSNRASSPQEPGQLQDTFA